MARPENEPRDASASSSSSQRRASLPASSPRAKSDGAQSGVNSLSLSPPRVAAHVFFSTDEMPRLGRFFSRCTFSSVLSVSFFEI